MDTPEREPRRAPTNAREYLDGDAALRDEVLTDLIADMGIVQAPREESAPLARRAEFTPPKVIEPPVPFIQRYDYETVLSRMREVFNQGWASWAYLGHVFPTREWWSEGTANLYMEMVGGLLPPGSRSLFDEWERVKDRFPQDEKLPLRQMEFADRIATSMGLTIRQKGRTFKALPREKLAPMIDPERRIDAPEQFGVLQLAAKFADSARKSKDTFFVVDTAKGPLAAFGSGKSHLLIQILSETAAILGAPFDLRHDLVLSRDWGRLWRFLRDRTPLRCRGVDELQPFAYKRRSARGEQQDIIDVLNTNRKWGQIWGGCISNIWQVDEFLREVKITHRIRIVAWDEERRAGTAQVYLRSGELDEPKDKWGLYDFEFDYNAIRSSDYLRYKECIAYVEDNQRNDRRSALDDWLAKHPEWPDKPESQDLTTPNPPLSP